MSSDTPWLQRVKQAIAEAERWEFREDFTQAIACYEKALDLIPDPRERSPYATRLLMAIGELHYMLGDNEAAFVSFSQAVRCEGGLGNPQIHLRLGQLRHAFGETERAKDELMRAYMGSGRIIFDHEDPKYYALIADIVEKKGG